MRTYALLLILSQLLCRAQPDQKALAQQAYLFAYPLVLMDVTREAAGPANQFAHLRRFPDDKFRYIVRPNADTLYSNVWLDLSKEPMLLHVPDTQGRFYLIQLMDAWTETISAPGKRTTGTGEGWFAIVGPGWKGTLPARATRIDCPTNMAWILGRTQTNSASDYENVHKIQDGYRIMPLSRYPDGGATARPATPPNARQNRVPPPDAVAQMTTVEFFNRFAQLLQANPAHAADAPMMKKLAEAGIRPGEKFAAPSSDFEAGVAQAKKLLGGAEELRRSSTNLSATKWSKLGASIGRYGTNYVARAVVAKIGLGANPPEDAVYLNCNLDATGAVLDGSHLYQMHFEKDQLPPVQAFWSISVYDLDGYFVPNPINRFAIGDRDSLHYNADGSLDIYIQSLKPQADRVSNWLPTPAGSGFVLTIRLYWPKPEILNGSWTPPAVILRP